VTLREVRIVQLPVKVHRRAAEHTDAINRELSLIAVADDDSVPARLRTLSEQLTARYGGLTAAQTEQLDAAIEAGVPSIELVYKLPPDVADASEQLAAMLDEVDDYCRSGDLLSLVTPPEAKAYRDWFLGEFVRQVRHGAEPRPWPGFDADDGRNDQTAAGHSDDSETARIVVEGALDLDGASRLRPVVSEHLDDGRTTLVFDLADCDFVDSVGLSLLLTTRQRCLEMGGSLRVEHLQPFVRTTFTHAGLLQVLHPDG
jgi:anti-anti-sigma factor